MTLDDETAERIVREAVEKNEVWSGRYVELVRAGYAARDAEVEELRAERDKARDRLAGILERDEEVSSDEGWHIGGAWGDYGEVVVPLRVLSYVIDGELDQKVVSTDPDYAATYAEQVRRADRAEATLEEAREYIEALSDSPEHPLEAHHRGVLLAILDESPTEREALPTEAMVRAGAYVLDEGAMDAPEDYPFSYEAAMTTARDVLVAALAEVHGGGGSR